MQTLGAHRLSVTLVIFLKNFEGLKHPCPSKSIATVAKQSDEVDFYRSDSGYMLMVQTPISFLYALSSIIDRLLSKIDEVLSMMQINFNHF